MWYREEWQLTQMRIAAYWNKWGSISNKFGLTRSCVKCCFSTITQGLTPVSRLWKPSNKWRDGISASTPQPKLSTFRFSPLRTPETCRLRKEVRVTWRCGQPSENLVASTARRMVLVGHTCSCSMLAQSYRTTWRVCRKSGCKLRFQQHYVLFSRFLNKHVARKKM